LINYEPESFPEKNWSMAENPSEKYSVGMMKFPIYIYGKIIQMFQTTNQRNHPPTGKCSKPEKAFKP